MRETWVSTSGKSDIFLGGNGMCDIRPDEYMVIYDEELGAVYGARKGIVKPTAPGHAQAIENCLQQYFEGKMSEQDRQDFEAYMKRSFGDAPDLLIEPCPNLFERDELNRLQILVATDCNLRCKYCYAHGGNYGMKSERLSPSIACTYLTKLLVGKYRRVKKVSFFGGEPTLCPDTIQAVCEFFEESTENGIFDEMPHFLMVSNGTLIDEKMANLIHMYDIKVTISIDGPEEIHDLNRVDAAGKGSFSRVIRGIEMLNQVGSPPALLEATYTMKHKKLGYTWDDILDYLRKEFHTKDVMLASCNGGGIEDGLAYENNDPRIQDIGETPFPDIGFTVHCLDSGKISDAGCDVAYGSMALLPNGDIYPCQFFVQHKEFKIADFHNGDFDFSDYDSVLSRFSAISKSRNERCANCWAKQVCSSCPAEFLVTGESGSKLDSSCNITRLQQSHMILKCAKMDQFEND